MFDQLVDGALHLRDRHGTDILQKDMQELVKRAGLSQGSGSRADFGAYMAKEHARWTQLITANNITTD